MDERFELIKDLDNEYVLQTFNRLPVAFVRGKGTRIWDTGGREYLDLVSGLGVTVLGHCHPAVTEAVREQAARLLHTTNLYYVEPQASLARLLVQNSFPGRCFFANSGAEANEGALKLARKYHFIQGKPRRKVVCVEGAFHGRTLATLSATGQPGKWKPFEPVMPGFEHVAIDDPVGLRDAVDEDTAAVMLELIQGESGVHPVSEEVIHSAREACDRSGALLIADEVQTGLGRTGELFAYQHYGVIPDVMTLAKGIANGIPAAAFIVGSKYVDAFVPGDHGSTFGGGFVACSAAHGRDNRVRGIAGEGRPPRGDVAGATAVYDPWSAAGYRGAGKRTHGRGTTGDRRITGRCNGLPGARGPGEQCDPRRRAVAAAVDGRRGRVDGRRRCAGGCPQRDGRIERGIGTGG